MTKVVPLLLAALALAPQGASALAVEVMPVRLDLTRAAPNGLLTVKNGSAAPARYQIRAYGWEESPQGEMKLSDPKELSVFPALLQLAPGDSRKVRIGTTAAPGAKERTWRVFAEELPEAVEQTKGASVRILTRVGIPVFLEPVLSESRPAVEVAAAGGGKLEVRLRNSGTVHFRPTAINLLLTNEKGERIHDEKLNAWYVLAGAERVYPVAVPPAVCGLARRAEVIALVDGKQLVGVLDLPSGSCAP
jgi:fimbrial chaperone protein